MFRKGIYEEWVANMLKATKALAEMRRDPNLVAKLANYAELHPETVNIFTLFLDYIAAECGADAAQCLDGMVLLHYGPMGMSVCVPDEVSNCGTFIASHIIERGLADAVKSCANARKSA